MLKNKGHPNIHIYIKTYYYHNIILSILSKRPEH